MKNYIKLYTNYITKIFVLCLLFMVSCNTKKGVTQKKIEKETLLFTEAGKDIIPLEDRSRRKWDSAIVADLDQDGLQDMILIEHSWRVFIFWNEGGKFSEPYNLVNGDLHGVTVSDYDDDGLLNLIVVQGGGGGSKPRNPLIYQVQRNRKIVGGEQLAGLEKTRGRAAKLIDADSNGTLDLLITGFPTPEQLELGANNIHKNNGDGNFKFLSKLPHASRLSYKTLVTDYNNDNTPDFIFYGGDDLVAATGKADLSYTKAEDSIFREATKTKEVSSITEIDFDNDGDFDLFLTRTQHAFKGETFLDTINKRFAFFTRFKPFEYEDLKIEGDFKLENLQMAYPHFDVFVGANKRKLTFKKDKHGHKDFTLKPNEAKGWPTDMTDKGLYIGYVNNGMWRIAGDTKSPTAGVVHNVISRPKTDPLELMPAVLLENRNGVFIDVTTQMGISIPEQTTNATVGDFNNDGWQDLFVVRYGNPAKQNEQFILMNEHGKSFVKAENHGIISKELGATGGHAQTIDYDNDGDLDIVYSNERGKWHLYTNASSQNNNYVVVKVGASPGKDVKQAKANGTVITIKACENIYKRVVGATSSPYSQGLNTEIHIGLGKCIKIDEAKIRWTNGEEMTFTIKKLNTTVFIGEK